MAEERFDRIEQALGRIEAGHQELGGRIEAAQQDLGRRIDAVHLELSGRIEDVNHHMHLLHEDVVGRIAAVAEYATIVEAKMDRGFAETKTAIAREVDPLKAVVRQHSVEIDDLKKRRG